MFPNQKLVLPCQAMVINHYRKYLEHFHHCTLDVSLFKDCIMSLVMMKASCGVKGSEGSDEGPTVATVGERA